MKNIFLTLLIIAGVTQVTLSQTEIPCEAKNVGS